MDSYRGEFGDRLDSDDRYDPSDDEVGHELPPLAIGQDERRMQVRVYNHWASLLADRAFPAIASLATGSLPDFDPYSVLLDFSEGVENPGIRYLGTALAEECDTSPELIRSLEDVPSRSLLSRITDHYLQIHANQAPIGFEAEFVNQLGRTILYRGILLPFSATESSEGIDLIYGVINWKELADQQTTDALLSEIDRALETRPQRSPLPLVAEWADGPADSNGDVLDLAAFDDSDWSEFAGESESSGEMCLADWLASARELARAAQGSEDRSRQALYAAIGRAWDFAIAAREAPEDFEELLADGGMKMQDRAPYTPVVKLVFGADYDKTRLTEYASAMAHAHRQGIGRGELASYLGAFHGGLKGVVHAERRLKREESGKPTAERDGPQERLERKLREVETRPLSAIEVEGEEFAVLIVRRPGNGEVMIVSEIAGDAGLLERAARHLAG